MIRLTRLSGEAFILNADLIQYVESRPDTFIKLTTGDRVVVAESDDEVLRRAVVYQQSKNLIPAPSPTSTDVGRSGMDNQVQDNQVQDNQVQDNQAEGV